MSHKLTKKEKQQKGGQLARALGLHIAPRTGLYAVGKGLTAERAFDLAHGVVCAMHCEEGK